jgi:hypothetical protein
VRQTLSRAPLVDLIMRQAGRLSIQRLVRMTNAMAIMYDALARIVDSLEVLGGIALDTDSHEDAARLFAAAQHLRDRTGCRRCVSERDADLEDLRAYLGDVQELYDQGQSLPFEKAIEYARRARSA